MLRRIILVVKQEINCVTRDFDIIYEIADLTVLFWVISQSGPGQAPGLFSQYPVRREWFRPKPKQCLLVVSKVFRFVKKRTWHIRKVKFRYSCNNSGIPVIIQEMLHLHKISLEYIVHCSIPFCLTIVIQS